MSNNFLPHTIYSRQARLKSYTFFATHLSLMGKEYNILII